MKYLSVCSGIEAASVAWHSLGWTPLAFSEIEAFPRAVLEHHYPDTPLHGDFTVLKDQPWIADADILVGGTPCQAFSVAGLRKSLDDDRGNLSLEFIRLADSIDAAREAQGRDPSVIVWENVPGVLSVKDNAFGCFLAALAGDAAPYDPPRGKWTNAGVVDGPARTVAWRILDAQYFGLAQRRRRVFVVASARAGFDPAAVLLEFEGLRRDTPPRREARQVAPTIPSRSTAGGGLGTDFDLDGGVIQSAARMVRFGEYSDDGTASTLKSRDYKDATDLVTHSLRAEGFDASEDGTGRGTPLVPVAFNARQDPDHWMQHTGPLDTDGSTQAVAIPMQEVGKRTGVSTDDPRAGIGIGADGDPMYTLQAGAQHGVALSVSLRGRDGGGTAELGDDVQNALRASQGGGDKPHVLAAVNVQASQSGVRLNDTAGTLDSNYGSRRHNGVMVNMAVRRLTPVECSRLQGFPDDYLLSVTWRGKCPPPDGPMYKALGNSMAVPVMRWIGRRIAEALR